MATKKQQRRREKLRRHEYEEVWVDEEGREIEPPPEAGTPRPRKTEASKPRAAASRPRGARPVRTVPPPSWNRVFRRAAVFAPLMLVVVYLLSKDRQLNRAIMETAILMAFFLPFSYVMDLMMYRTYLRRTGAAPAQPRKKKP